MGSVVFIWLLGIASVKSADAGLELFEKQIRPVFVETCGKCHGEKKQKGGLRLDSRAGWLKGGDNGQALIPGELDASLLIKAVRYESADLKMPPKGKLPTATIRAFEEWVKLGAPDPRKTIPHVAKRRLEPTVEEGRGFWSFQPIRKPAVPASDQSAWSRSDIDRFIIDRLNAAKLQPASDAGKATLIRRLFFDLLGLPPTPEQIGAFADDRSDKAYETLVDRLLASKHFGERWGRHWLDVVRFAESSGGGRTLLMPNAWRYRDYVIDAFNDDLPYDRFIREQIAGDLTETADWRERRRQITATAFLVLGPTNYELQDKDMLEMDIIDEQLDTMGKAFMGMTIGCARCHDHKFDPIPTKDYYAMAGILKSTKSVIHSNVSKWNETGLPLPPEEEKVHALHSEKLAALNSQLTKLKAEFNKLGGKLDKKKAAASGKSIPLDSLPGIVVDDSKATREGNWTSSTSTKFYVGDGYIHDANEDKGAKTITFSPELPKAGRYEVQIACVPFSNRSANVPVTIHFTGGSKTIRVNQKATGPIEGYRTSLGEYEFDPRANPRVVLSNEDTDDGVVIADAVLFIPKSGATVARAVPSLPNPDEVDIPENIKFIVSDSSKLPGIVLDDTEAQLVGEWGQSVHTPPFVGAGYLHDQKTGKGEKSATFTPNLSQSGIYEVRLSHNTNIRRSTNAPVTIRHADGETVLRVNEGEAAPIDNLFRSLGKFRFERGRKGSVTISNEGTEGKYVIVDSVQFIRQQNAAELAAAEASREAEKHRSELSSQIAKLGKEITGLEKSGPARPIAMAVTEEEEVGDIPLAIRGVVHNKGPIVSRGMLQIATLGPMPSIPDGKSGRIDLAEWLADPGNPLTSRVIVNRIWHWLVGQGIVRTVDSFGATGERPSHPELLDYLAASLMENGWSLKQLIRKIVLSRTYQMSTASDSAALKVDPDNRLLARMNRKRLDAECIRDAFLFVSGQLDLKVGGSNIKSGTKSEYGYQFESTRRSVYLPVFRNALPEIFETFDFADPNIQNGRRTSSTIAPQALLLLNNPFVINSAEAAAKTLLKRSELTTQERIDMAYLQVLGRKPTARELDLTRKFIGPEDELNRWQMFYQTLFQSLDFRYLH